MSQVLMTLILAISVSCQAALDYSDRDKTTTTNNDPASGDISQDTVKDTVTNGNKDNTTPTTLDTDGDGIPDTLDTDDVDNEGINDSDEALIGTNPLLADSDLDGIADGLGDFDSDGLSNADESNASLSTATDADADGNPDISN